MAPRPSHRDASDFRMEQLLGRTLRIGVLASAVVVAAGGMLLLASHTGWVPAFAAFTGAREPLRTVPGILAETLAFRADALVQLGFVLLIATPVLRVLFSLAGFIQRRDWVYTVLTLIVAGVLAAGLLAR